MQLAVRKLAEQNSTLQYNSKINVREKLIQEESRIDKILENLRNLQNHHEEVKSRIKSFHNRINQINKTIELLNSIYATFQSKLIEINSEIGVTDCKLNEIRSIDVIRINSFKKLVKENQRMIEEDLLTEELESLEMENLIQNLKIEYSIICF